MPEKSLWEYIVLIIILLVAVGVIGFFASGSLSNKQENQASTEQSKDAEGESRCSETTTPQSSNKIRSLMGEVESVDEANNQITVRFSHGGKTWSSQVIVTDSTFMGSSLISDEEVDSDKMPDKIFLSDFSRGQSVVVSSNESIVNKDIFEATGVILVRQN